MHLRRSSVWVVTGNSWEKREPGRVALMGLYGHSDDVVQEITLQNARPEFSSSFGIQAPIGSPFFRPLRRVVALSHSPLLPAAGSLSTNLLDMGGIYGSTAIVILPCSHISLRTDLALSGLCKSSSRSGMFVESKLHDKRRVRRVPVFRYGYRSKLFPWTLLTSILRRSGTGHVCPPP